MADDRTQTAKESKGFRNRLKKVFRYGSQSTPQSRSNSPPPIDAPVPVPSVHPAPTVTMTLEEAAKLRAKYTHFRILVIGRANAGKTTLLKRVCNTKEDPVYNSINPTEKRGIHNVCDEFTFKSNPQFIFHDSPGFEAGGEKELIDVMSFIKYKAKAREVGDQIHVIWFCFEPDVSRPLLELEKAFFNEQRLGNVPVVAIFMKFDILVTKVYDRQKDEEENQKIAHMTLKEKFENPLMGYDYPPCAYVRFESLDNDEGNHQKQVGELIKQTAASIDNLALKMLFVNVQQNNLEICIECAVNQHIFKNDSILNLIISAASWFGHCYDVNKDYGNEEAFFEIRGRRQRQGSRQGFGQVRFRRGELEFGRHIVPFVKDHYNTPSLPAFAAILICLENSFWHAQQGTAAEHGFQLAFQTYLSAKMEKHFILQWTPDWFAIPNIPAQTERTRFINAILHNRLSRPKAVV